MNIEELRQEYNNTLSLKDLKNTETYLEWLENKYINFYNNIRDIAEEERDEK
jgi:hypothetical protein